MRGVGADLEGYVTLAIDPETGARSERYLRVEHILTELTGAEAAAVVNNNAAATLLALSAMAGGKEAIVSRGQLIEIGGSFRLPDVMSQSGAKLVEVGTTNRTHLKDYRSAITDQTAIIMRVHPSNYRIMGFTSQPGLDELVALAHEHNMPLLDDLGAGALVNLEDLPTPLPHEPTVQESIAAGADVVLFSADKLIGASQGGVIVGRKRYIEAIRNHPLYRALRPDKMCLMVLERTLHLFRDPKRLLREHPLYSMLTATPEALVESAVWEASLFEEHDFHDFKISVKHNDPVVMVRAYELLSERGDWPLHLGVTEAGPAFQGTVKSAVAFGALLSRGVGDTIRVSLSAPPVEEVKVGIQILQSLNLRERRLEIVSCPSCGRAQVDVYTLAEQVTAGLEGMTVPLRVAVMGCVVNGPGEAREADLGVASGNGKGQIFVRGEVVRTVTEEEIVPTLVEEARRLEAALAAGAAEGSGPVVTVS